MSRPEAARRPELTVIVNPLAEFDGTYSEENLNLLVGIVNEQEGRIRELQEELREADDTAAGQDATIRRLGSTITKLRRDKEREARASDEWPVGERLFRIWQRATGSTRSQFRVDRFDLVRPFIAKAIGQEFTPGPGPPANELEECAAAIIGRVYDHYSETRPNGKTVHYWEFDRIFKNSSEFDKSVERRPRDWRERLARLDEGEDR